MFDATRRAARRAVTGQRGLGVTGVEQLVDRLLAARDALLPTDITDTSQELGLIGAVSTTGDLPATAVVDGTERAITWSNASRAAAWTAYQRLSLSGWTSEPVADGLRQAVTATVQVAPPALRYFVDSGLAADQQSPQYDAVAGTFPLLNTVPDRAVPDAVGWGHVADGLVTKSGTPPADIFSTRVYAAAGRTVRYQFALGAGSYELTAGFREWWGQTRPMSQTLTTPSGAGTVTAPGAVVALSGATPTATDTVRFTLTQAATISYTVARTGSQDPVISWVGVAGTTD